MAGTFFFQEESALRGFNFSSVFRALLVLWSNENGALLFSCICLISVTFNIVDYNSCAFFFSFNKLVFSIQYERIFALSRWCCLELLKRGSRS